MTIKEHLIAAGYEEAKYPLRNRMLNKVARLLAGKKTDMITVCKAFQYVCIEQEEPHILGSRGFSLDDGDYYLNRFTKLDMWPGE